MGATGFLWDVVFSLRPPLIDGKKKKNHTFWLETKQSGGE